MYKKKCLRCDTPPTYKSKHLYCTQHTEDMYYYCGGYNKKCRNISSDNCVDRSLHQNIPMYRWLTYGDVIYHIKNDNTFELDDICSGCCFLKRKEQDKRYLSDILKEKYDMKSKLVKLSTSVRNLKRDLEDIEGQIDKFTGSFDENMKNIYDYKYNVDKEVETYKKTRIYAQKHAEINKKRKIDKEPGEIDKSITYENGGESTRTKIVFESDKNKKNMNDPKLIGQKLINMYELEEFLRSIRNSSSEIAQ